MAERGAGDQKEEQEQEEEEEDGSDGDDDEEGVITEIRFVPGDKAACE